MIADYLGVLILLGAAVAMAVGVVILQLRTAANPPSARTDEPGETSDAAESSVAAPHARLSANSYLAVTLFVVFDVAAMFFHPWAATFREVGTPALIAMGVFVIPLVAGLAYEWAKGAFEW